MELCWITLHTDRMEESLYFYTKVVGLDIDSRFSPDNDAEIAMLGKKDRPKIELIYQKSQIDKIKSDGISIGFTVKSLEDTIEKVKKEGIPIKAGPISPNPGIRFFMVSDPNGVTVQFVENIGS